MHKSVSLLLAVSLSLYSTPLKADSYDSELENYADMTSDNEGTSCPVRPEPVEERQQAVSPPEEEYAQQPDDESAPTEEIYASDQGNYTDQETMVTPESSHKSQRGGYKYWKNILVAVVVIAVAVTALLVVHSHEGHKSHH